jgi:SAM-dependent methyltransferase
MNENNNNLLSTVDPESFMQWQLLLEHQVSTFWPYELNFLLSSDAWVKGHNILDVGCGNGHYLGYLRHYFPDKRYAGIDLSPQHIAAAKFNPQLVGVELSNASLADYRPSELFDVVMMRLVVQHLDDLDLTLAQVRRLVKPTGAIIITEPNPIVLMNFPRTPKFEKLLINYSNAKADTLKNQAKLNEFARQLGGVPGWEISQKAEYTAPSIGPFSGSSLLQIFSLWIDIFEKSKLVKADFQAVRDEINAWAASDKSFNRIGLQIYCLRALPSH